MKSIPFDDSLANHVNAFYGISNDAVDELCRLLSPTHYGGTFAAEDLPKKIKTPSNFIINIGGHFVTLVVQPKYCLYIDPFGLPCLNQYLQKCIRLLDRALYYNQRQLQSPKSLYCGLYCILFTLYFDKARKNKLTFHRKKLLANDRRCLYYIHEMV